jgi:hypothetical protein
MRIKASAAHAARGVALCLFMSILPAGRAQAQGIREQYANGQYAEVAKQLLERRQKGQRTPEADYMLATSLCRAGERERGAALLAWMGSEWSQDAKYRLSSSIRKALPTELEACSIQTSTQFNDGGGSFTDTTASYQGAPDTTQVAPRDTTQ